MSDGEPSPAHPTATRLRTPSCGELRSEHVGQTVALCGWLHNRRDLGGLAFIDLRDHYGITQVVITSGLDPDPARLPKETVLRITGEVVRRSPETTNPALDTGEVEVVAKEAEVLGPAEPLPFSVFPE